MSLSFCLFCSTPTSNSHGFCSEQCYDGHALALEETKLLPAVPDDECPLCGSAKDCTCSYIPAPLDDEDIHQECTYCGEVFCVCERESWDGGPSAWDDDYTVEPFDTDLQCEW